jgi:hypothetical protein
MRAFLMAAITDKTADLMRLAYKAAHLRKDFATYNPFIHFINSIHISDVKSAQINNYEERVFINFASRKEYELEADLSDLAWLSISYTPKNGKKDYQIIHVNWRTFDWNAPNKFYMSHQDKEILNDFYNNFILFIKELIAIKTVNIVPFNDTQIKKKIEYIYNLIDSKTSDVAAKLNDFLSELAKNDNCIKKIEKSGNIRIVQFWNDSKMLYDIVNSTIVIKLTEHLGLMILATLTKPRLKLVLLKSNPKEIFGDVEGISLDHKAIGENLNEIANVLTQIIVGALNGPIVRQH